jgi:hypothetical protein
MRDRAADDETSRLNPDHLVNSYAGEGLHHCIDRAAKALRVLPQGCHVTKHHAGFRVIRDCANVIVNIKRFRDKFFCRFAHGSFPYRVCAARTIAGKRRFVNRELRGNTIFFGFFKITHLKPAIWKPECSAPQAGGGISIKTDFKKYQAFKTGGEFNRI